MCSYRVRSVFVSLAVFSSVCTYCVAGVFYVLSLCVQSVLVGSVCNLLRSSFAVCSWYVCSLCIIRSFCVSLFVRSLFAVRSVFADCSNIVGNFAGNVFGACSWCVCVCVCFMCSDFSWCVLCRQFSPYSR